jgi:hypothetical protein
MSKIASADASAMNTLYKAELSRVAKVAGAAYGDNNEDPDAFKDHAEYEKVLEEVLSTDTKNSFDPNDPILD